MKFLLSLFVLFMAGFSYSQTFRPVGSNIEREISVCTQYRYTPSTVKPRGNNVFLEKEECLKYQSCNLHLYTTEEPVVAVCQCHVRHSSLHPEYSPENSFPYENFHGVDMDRNVAEEEARAGCLDTQDRVIGNENRDHWVTSIKCGLRYRYICEDGSVEMRNNY